MTQRSEFLEQCNVLREAGDVKKIAAIAKCTVQNVYIAFRTGKCSDRVFNAIVGFYADRSQTYKELNNKLQTT